MCPVHAGTSTLPPLFYSAAAVQIPCKEKQNGTQWQQNGVQVCLHWSRIVHSSARNINEPSSSISNIFHLKPPYSDYYVVYLCQYTM